MEFACTVPLVRSRFRFSRIKTCFQQVFRLIKQSKLSQQTTDIKHISPLLVEGSATDLWYTPVPVWAGTNWFDVNSFILRLNQLRKKIPEYR